MSEAKTISENEFYLIKHNEEKNAVKLVWKNVPDLIIEDFKKGILQFSSSCHDIQPEKAIIDARQLSQVGDPFLWVSGQKQIDGVEEYNSWWRREIAPVFNQARVAGLGVVTGNPEAPGELPEVPEGVHFKIAYFTDFDQVLAWKAN